MREVISLFAVSVCGVTGVVDSGMGDIDMIGEDVGTLSDDHSRGDWKRPSNSEPALKLKLVMRLEVGGSGNALIFRLPVLERRLTCFLRGLLGAS